MYSFLIILLIKRKTYLSSIQHVFIDGLLKVKHCIRNKCLLCIYYIACRGHFYYIYRKKAMTNVMTVLFFDCHIHILIITLIVFNDQTIAKLFPLLEIQRKYSPIFSVWRYKLRISGNLALSFKKYFHHLFSNTEASSCGMWPLKGKYSRTFLQNKLSVVV